MNDMNTVKIDVAAVRRDDNAGTKRPGNALLVVSTALFAVVAMALAWWALDPKVTHAQASLIVSVVLILAATSALTLHLVRQYVRSSEDRLTALIDLHAIRIRSQYYDLSDDVSAMSAEVEAMKSAVGDFVKRGDHQIPELVTTVSTIGRIVVGLSTSQRRDPADQEAEWLTEAVELGRQLEAEEYRRRNGGAAV